MFNVVIFEILKVFQVVFWLQGETILGEPDQILKLGRTELPYSVFLEYIFALGESTYK